MKGDLLNKASATVFFLSFVVFIFILSFGSLRGGDYWWQLLDGQRNFATGTINTGPAFTFGESRQPYYDEYFLYDVILALLVQGLGDPGVLVCFALITIIPFVHLFSQKKAVEEPLKLFLLSVFIFYFSFQRIMQRPEIVGTFCLYLVGAWLLAERPWQRRWPAQAVLFLYFALWANVHVSFILGIFIVLLWAIDHILRHQNRETVRWSVRILAISLAGTLLNPYGLFRWWLPFRNQADFWTIVNSYELHALPDSKMFEFVVLSLFFIAFSFWHRAQVPRWVIAFFLVVAAMTILHMRYLSLMTTALLWAVLASLHSFSSASANARPAAGIWFFLRTAFIIVLSICLWTYNLNAAWFRLPQRLTPAYHRNYSPETVGRLTQTPDGPHFVLGSIEVSSYAAPAGRGQLYVLCDTGQGRFDPQTLRYFFYLYNYPQAVAYALDQLDVDRVVINQAFSHWTPVCRNNPHWSCVAQTQDGFLFQKNSGQSPEKIRPDIASSYFKDLVERGNFLEAYFLSDGLLAPGDRADLLMRALQEQMNHYFANFWPFLELSIDRLPRSALGPDHQLILQLKNKDWAAAAAAYQQHGARLQTANFMGANIYLRAGRVQEAFQISKLFSRQTIFDAGAAEMYASLLRFRQELPWPRNPKAQNFPLLEFSASNQQWFREYTDVLNQRIHSIKQAAPTPPGD